MSTLLVASETHFVRDASGAYFTRLGVDGYAFWQRYLDPFTTVVVAARTAEQGDVTGLERVDGPGVRVCPLPEYHGFLGALQQHTPIRLALEAAVREVDAVCVRAPGVMAGLAWRASAGRPFAVEVVGDPIDAFAPGAVRSVVRPFARALFARDLRAMCRTATAVSYVTEHALQARYPAGGWTTACSDVRLQDEMFVTPEQVRERLATRSRAQGGTSAAPWRILFVGSLAQLYKGQDVLIDAVATCRRRGLPLQLTIAGDGHYRGVLEARARRAQAPIAFVGQVPAGEGVRALLDQSDVFVLPSRTEGMPRAMLEAMARGIPCLGTRVGGIPELLPASRLMAPGNVSALVHALFALCGTPEGLLGPALQDLARARQFRSSVLTTRWRDFLAQLGGMPAVARAGVAA